MKHLSLRNRDRGSVSRGLSEATTDLQIVCRDGIVKTHQAILSWSSAFLRRIFTSHFLLEDGGKRKDEAQIILDSFSVEVVAAFVNFMIYGELSTVASKSFIEEFKHLWDSLKVDKITFDQVYEDGKTLQVVKPCSLSSTEKKSLSSGPKNLKPPPSTIPTTVKPLRSSNFSSKSPHHGVKKPKQSTMFKSPSMSKLQGTLTKKPPIEPKVLPETFPVEQTEVNGSKDDDAIMIVDEVKATNPIAMLIKRELPAGINISISKQNSGEMKEETAEKPSSELVKVVEGSKGNEVTVSPVITEGHSSPAVTRQRTTPTPRKMSRRSAAAAVSTYNLDMMEEAVFKKARQEDCTANISKYHQQEIVAKTKNLRIPLSKVSGVAKSSPMVITPSDLKTPLKDSPKSNKTPVVKSTIKVTKEAPEVQDPEVESITCYICKGTKDANNRTLSLRNQSSLRQLRQHISLCLYEAGKLFRVIPPGPDNSDGEGRPLDEMGAVAGKFYSCEVEGCWLAARKGVTGRIGYKQYSIHMASHHGAMDFILMEDGEEAEKLMERIMEFEGSKNTSILKSEEVSNVTLDEVSVPVVKAEKKDVKVKAPIGNEGSESEHLRCRFEGCNALPFKADNKREIKLHYASKHFSDYFLNNPKDNFIRRGNRTICQVCSNNAPKPVFIQSEKEAIRGHLVVKHDIMSRVLKEVRGIHQTEARLAFQDIYPA